MQRFNSNRRAVLKSSLSIAATLPLLGAARAVFAQDSTLRVALSAPPTTLDPHLYNAIPNNALARHIFEPVVGTDEQTRSIPGLASSWRQVDDTHWEFNLRQDVKFSDGSSLTVEDIVASIERASSISTPGNFQVYTRSIKSITHDGDKVLIETKYREVLLPNSISRIGIIKAKFRNAKTEDFNDRSAAIGAGPFAVADYAPGERITLVRNDSYWGPKPYFERVEMKIIPDDAARTAALLSGDYDIIEDLPHTGIKLVEAAPDLHIVRAMSGRLIYLAMDQYSEISPFVKNKAGKPLTSNPFRDLRVRKALSLAINRKAIVKQVMAGEAEVASQFLQVGRPGTSPDIESDRYDPEAARALLAEAGYPDGFQLTIHGPNNRYINDEKIVQAIAQMFARIGVATTVEVMPWSVYSGRNNKGEFSVSLSSWGTNTGETSNPMSATVATKNAAKGIGGSNPGRYSNPVVDENLERAAAAKDDTERNAILANTSKIVFEDKAILPIHHEMVVVGARKTIQYSPRSDQFLLVTGAKRA